MTDMTNQECDPVALITYHAGIAVDMNYSPAVSVTGLSKIAPAFINYFRYAGTVTLQYRQFFSYSSWTDKMKADLDAGQPIIYYGDDGTAGHAWICDGYQGTDMFHMNWGWSGNYNGYFNIDDLNPGSFNPDLNQAAVFGIKPDPAQYPYYCSGQTNLTTYGSGTIEDGSGPVNDYQPGFNCSWLILPDDSVQNITLRFTRFSTSVGDYVTVHDGSSDDDPVLGSFSGSSVPTEITSTGPALFLTFKWGGDASVSSGWMAKYSSTYHTFCSGETILTDLSGTLTDGSGRFPYRNNSSCIWKIMPECPNPGPATLKFTTFNTEQDQDKMEIFDLVSGSLLASYSGVYSTPPDSVISPSGKMLISFITSPAARNNGWEATYHVKCYGQSITEKLIEDPEVYPVPADDLLNISFTNRHAQSLQIDLITVEGKIVFTDKILNPIGRHTRKIDFSHLANGIYFLRITGDASVTVNKIIVQKQ